MSSGLGVEFIRGGQKRNQKHKKSKKKKKVVTAERVFLSELRHSAADVELGEGGGACSCGELADPLARSH